MRLTYPLFETPILFSEGKVNVIVIENQRAFFEFVLALSDKENGIESDVILSKNFEEERFDKIADVVTDVVSLDCNNKKVMSKLYGKMSEIAFEDGNYTLTMDIAGRISEYLLNIIQDLPCGVIFDENIDLSQLFKSVALRIDTDSKNILEKLCDYIEVMNEFCKTELFVFSNLKSYLNSEELIQFYKFCEYKKVYLLLVENVVRERLEMENVKIIDNDLCEIY